jgi:hypothetical protein
MEEGEHKMDDVYAINVAKSRMREGFDSNDVEMILSVYDDSYVDMSCGFPSFYDSDAKDVFRARLKRLFQGYCAQMTVIIIRISVYGDRAVDRGWHVLKLTSKTTGEALEIRTRYFENWRRDTSRGWVITNYIDNLDLPSKLPEEEISEIESAEFQAIATRSLDRSSQFAAKANFSDVP